MKPNGKMVWMEITPDQAEAWLILNTENRKLRADNVTRLKKEILNQQYHTAGDAIIIQINSNGPVDESVLVLNGQHRLTAVYEAKKSIWAWVLFTEGIHRETVDMGANRSVADQLKLLNKTANAEKVASISRALLALQAKAPRPLKPVLHEIEAVYEKYREETDWAIGTFDGKKNNKWLRITSVMASFAFLRKKHPEEVAEFAEAVKSGANLAEGAPALTLRNYLMNLASGGLSHNQGLSFEIMLNVMRAFEASLKFKTIKQLKGGAGRPASEVIDRFVIKET